MGFNRFIDNSKVFLDLMGVFFKILSRKARRILLYVDNHSVNTNAALCVLMVVCWACALGTPGATPFQQLTNSPNSLFGSFLLSQFR